MNTPLTIFIFLPIKSVVVFAQEDPLEADLTDDNVDDDVTVDDAAEPEGNVPPAATGENVILIYCVLSSS